MPKHLKTILWLGVAGILAFCCLSAGTFYMPEPALDAPVKILFRIVFWLAFPVIMAVRFFWTDVDHHTQLGALILASFLALPVYCVFWWMLGYLRRSLTRKIPRAADTSVASIPRRVFLRRSAATVAGAAALTVPGYSVCIGPQRLKIRRYGMAIAGLPESLDELRIVQVSDTHLGPYVQRAYLRGVMEQANALKPDLIVLTGDYVHRSPLNVEPGIELLAELRARLGVVGVLGNHDHWEGAEACREVFRRIGIPLIDNSRKFLTAAGLGESIPTDPATAICIGGVGDHWEDAVLPEQAFHDVPASMPRILLSHNPDALEDFDPGLRIDLTIAGHTHGGQVALPIFGPLIVPSLYGNKYEGGLCQSPVGPVIVSRGVGMTVLPVRLNVPPELVEITLTGKE